MQISRAKSYQIPETIPLLLWLCLGLVLLLSAPLLAAEDGEELTDAQQWSELTQLLDQAETRLKNNVNDNNNKVLEEITQNTIRTNKYAQECITRNETLLTRTTESIDSLGETPLSGSLSTTGEKLRKEKQAIEKILAQCRLLNLRATNIQEQVRQVEQGAITQRLMTRDPAITYHILQILEQPEQLQQASVRLLNKMHELSTNFSSLYLTLIYGLIGMLAGFLWSSYKRRQYRQQTPDIIETSPAMATVWNSLIRTAPMLIFAGLVKLSFYIKPPDVKALDQLANALLVFTISYAILRAMLRPRHQLSGFNPVLPTTSKKLFYWARLFLLMAFFGTLFQAEIFDDQENNHLIRLIRIAIGTLAGLALMRLVWLLRKPLTAIRRFHLHLLSAGLMLTAIGALWLGYNNLALFLFQGTIGTVFVLLVGWLLIRIPIEIFDGLDEGRAAWQQRLRKRMGLTGKQIVPGLIWLRLAHLLVIGGLIIIVLLRLWGLSKQTFTVMLSQISSGIQLGDYTLEPAKILGGILVLAFIIVITQFIKRNLASSWLKRTNLSRGAKEATVTITGYTGTVIALFVGLSIAGINFTNVAIVAGALSVGIGFGLQNIVNNFISGLILLFERPIRRGDWIKVGATEGYVKDISIRSTVIQTFDRSDIIVPNSDLISNQVTNMMLDNQYGRVIIPLRIAYGEDPDKVVGVLQKVAESHPGVLREYGAFQVQVLFRSFGEYAMNFEVRCHIKDVEWVLIVTSELNIAISKALNEAGIKMPFPQQVVHLQRGAKIPENAPSAPAHPDNG
ncbi:MAG: mechanosensitive ion channel [Thiolinea sp.]